MGVSGFISRVDKKKWHNFKTVKHKSKLGYTAQCYHITQAQVIIEELEKWIMLQTEAF